MFECTSRTLDFLPAASRTLHRTEKNNIEINQRRRWLPNWLFRIRTPARVYKHKQKAHSKQHYNKYRENVKRTPCYSTTFCYISRTLMEKPFLSESSLDRSKILGSYKLLFQPINIKIVIYS